ncbi:MAG: DNA translocase FtsK 4TM domain-containing protein [Campylobacterales bacterium]
MAGLALLTFLAFATIIGSPALVGSFGASFSARNIELFGVLAYVYLFALIYASYKLYKNPVVDFKRASFTAAVSLLFILFLMLQSIVFEATAYQGIIGTALVDGITPFIGRGGFWIVWACSFVLSLALMAEEGVDRLFQKTMIFLRRFKPSFSLAKKEKAPSNKETAQKQSVKQAVVETEVESVTVAPFVADTVTQISEPVATEDSEPKSEPQVEKPKRAKKTASSDVEIVTELEENKALLDEIELGESGKPKGWKLPSSDFFAKSVAKKSEANEDEIDEKIKELIEKLRRFKIDGDVIRTYAGPVVTTFEFKPAAHIKVSRISQLQDDIAMALKAQTIRIQAPIPGKDVVGIEIPNKEIETIYMRDIIESDIFKKSLSPLTLIMGKDIVGNAFVTDLKKLPHLLIAGTTGSGKSVGINAMILSLLYKNSPDELRLVMIDPKMLEFSMYDGIPHLLTPVITKPKQAINALANMVLEMERRYLLMSKTKTKNIENFNEKAPSVGEVKLPYIVVIIDELADLMMTSGKEVELSIARLAQMARASGIHLIVATQRPSVDVVTGLIKANLPSRVSFKVGQKIDSKVILDQMGAESLLGRGDMLFTPPGTSGVVRLHAPWSSEAEIEKVVEFLKNQREPEYDESFLMEAALKGDGSGGDYDGGELDELYDEAKNIVLTERKSSISYIQRRLQIGYNRAARIVEQLEAMGVVSQANNKGNRDILS